MARPKKVNTDIMDSEAIIEVKAEAPKTEEEVTIATAITKQDIVPELVVEVVKPKVAEQDKTRMPTPICDIEELTDEDKQVLIEKKLKNIIGQTQIPYIPALVRYREPGTTAVPPMYALVDYDHRYVNEGWEFYKTNVREPYVKDYLQLISKLFNPHKIYTRLVTFNYE